MVLACESIFSRTSLDAGTQNLHTFSKVNPKYMQPTTPVGQAIYSFHLPFSYNLQILFAQGNGASTNVKPCLINSSWNKFVIHGHGNSEVKRNILRHASQKYLGVLRDGF